MQNFGVTNKEHYGMSWYFLEWSIEFCFAFASLETGGNWAELPFTKTSGIPVSRAVPDFFAKDKGPVCCNHAELFIDL